MFKFSFHEFQSFKWGSILHCDCETALGPWHLKSMLIIEVYLSNLGQKKVNDSRNNINLSYHIPVFQFSLPGCSWEQVTCGVCEQSMLDMSLLSLLSKVAALERSSCWMASLRGRSVVLDRELNFAGESRGDGGEEGWSAVLSGPFLGKEAADSEMLRGAITADLSLLSIDCRVVFSETDAGGSLFLSFKAWLWTGDKEKLVTFALTGETGSEPLLLPWLLFRLFASTSSDKMEVSARGRLHWKDMGSKSKEAMPMSGGLRSTSSAERGGEMRAGTQIGPSSPSLSPWSRLSYELQCCLLSSRSPLKEAERASLLERGLRGL